jgi:hypothetical protein
MPQRLARVAVEGSGFSHFFDNVPNPLVVHDKLDRAELMFRVEEAIEVEEIGRDLREAALRDRLAPFRPDIRQVPCLSGKSGVSRMVVIGNTKGWQL